MYLGSGICWVQCLVSCGRTQHSPDLTAVIVVWLDTRHPTTHSYTQYMHWCQRPQVSMSMGQRIWRSTGDPFTDHKSLCCHFCAVHSLENENVSMNKTNATSALDISQKLTFSHQPLLSHFNSLTGYKFSIWVIICKTTLEGFGWSVDTRQNWFV